MKRIKSKITKQVFMKQVGLDAKKAGYTSSLLSSDVAPCDCDYKNCEGWQIIVPPSNYLTIEFKLTNIK